MISFQSLNIMIGICGAAIVGAGAFAYIKRKSAGITARQTLICTLVSLAGFFVAFGLGNLFLSNSYQEWVIKEEISSIPIVDPIKTYHPKQYEELMRQVSESVKKHENPQDFITHSYFYVNKIFINDLKNAPDSAIYDYIIQVNHFYDAIFKINPAYVIRMERGDFSLRNDFFAMAKKDPDFKSIYIPALNAKKNIIVQAVTHPSAPPSEETARPLFKRVMKKLNTKYGAEAVNKTFLITQDHVSTEIESRIILDFYREIANLDKPEIGELMRYIASLSSKQNH